MFVTELPCCDVLGPHPAWWGLAGGLTFPDAGTEFSRGLPFVLKKPSGKNKQRCGLSPVVLQDLWAFPSTAGVSRTLWECGRGEPSPLSLQVAMNILNSGRFSMGTTVAGMLKKLIGR